MTEEQIKDFENRLFMFVMLMTEAEKWAMTLKGSVHHSFAFKLNRFLETGNVLKKHCESFYNPDDIEDASEVFSRILEHIKSDPNTIIAFYKELVEGNIIIQ